MAKRWMSLFAQVERELRSPLSSEQALERLRSEVDPPKLQLGIRPLIGTISGDRISVRRRTSWIGSPVAFASGHFVPDGAGSRIRIKVRINGLSSVVAGAVFTCWVGGQACVVTVTAFKAWFRGDELPLNGGLIVWTTWALLAFVAQRLASIGLAPLVDRHFLLEFVRDKISATIVSEDVA